MPEDQKKLFLIDAMALIYRAHFAFIRNPMFNTKGMNTSAVFGFVSALMDLLEKEKPSHIAVAFDSHGPTVRHEEFSDYKAGREKQPEDITLAIPIIKKILDGFKIPVIEKEGYEADDIIGTLAKAAEKEGYTVFMFTPDKDFAQLVDERIFIMKPGRGGNPPEIWDTERVKKEFGIKRIDQVIDIQGLAGDSIDNIPGIPGIGPVGAKKLIAEFDTIENLVKNTDKLKDKQRELVAQYADQALLSKKLARIITDVPVPFDEKEFNLDEPDKGLLESLFAELEFKNLSKRVIGKEPDKKAAEELLYQMADLFHIPTDGSAGAIKVENTENTGHFHLLKNEEEVKEFAQSLNHQKKICLYYEYFSKGRSENRFSGLSFEKEGEYYFLAVPDDEKSGADFIGYFKELLENPENSIYGYDLKQFISILKNYSIEINAGLSDVMIMHYLLDSESRHDIEFLSEKYIHHSFVFTPILGNTESLRDYFCERNSAINEISVKLEKMLTEGFCRDLYKNIESPLIRVLADMESEGVRVDQGILKEYSGEIARELGELEKEIYRISGVTFNINSPLQLGRVLFEIMKIGENAKKTGKSKQYSTSEDVLQKLSEEHEIARKLLDYRSLQKLRSTYVEALPQLINPLTGRIHTSFNQAVTSTGRLSSTSPNMQNIPIRTERGRFIRKAFVARNDKYMILSADYSQIELRLIADISDDESMIDAFMKGQDIHASTAAKIFNISLNEVTPEMRRKAKVVNFGIIYGISGWGLAQRLEIPRREGEEIISQYFQKFPRIKEYMNKTIEYAREKGFVETKMGRRRYIREINSRNATQRGFAERNAINAPIQGAAADMIKIAMISIHNEIKKQKLLSRMTLQVHDELVFDMYRDEKEIMTSLVRDKMETAMKLKVPLLVEIGVGENWLDAH